MTQRGRTLRRVALAVTAVAVTAAAAVTFPMIASAQAADQPGESATVQPATEPDPSDGDYGDHADDYGYGDPKDYPKDDPKDPKDPKDEDPKDPDGENPNGGGIAPGAQYVTADGQHFCTANFVYTVGDRTFIGSAAHCHTKRPEASTDLNGCDVVDNESQDLGTEILLRGFDDVVYTTTLAYSSWQAMQDLGLTVEADEARCFLNDLALLEIAPEDVDQVDPTVPMFGGPEGLDADGPVEGERVFSYQNEDDEPFPTMRAKQGINLGDRDPDGLGYLVRTMTPGLPGDSGSGYLGGEGQAFGVLSSFGELNGQIVNGVSDIAKALEYAVAYDGDLGGIAVVDGTEPFSAEGVPMDALPTSPLSAESLLSGGVDSLLSSLSLG